VALASDQHGSNPSQNGLPKRSKVCPEIVVLALTSIDLHSLGLAWISSDEIPVMSHLHAPHFCIVCVETTETGMIPGETDL